MKGNTPIMFFLMIGDYYASTLLLEKCKNLDLSIKNKHGINASYLLVDIDYTEKALKEMLIHHKTFDYDFVDNDNNTLIMHLLVRIKPDIYFKYILEKKKMTNQVNNKNENALIIATKLGKLYECLFDGNDINHQDYIGNTALYYAIKLKDKEAINKLIYHKADPNIKNYQGVSALDLANELNENYIFKIMKNPLPPGEMKYKLEKKENNFSFFDKGKKKEEKLNDYIQNYQINNYKKEYEYLLEKKGCSYSPIKFNIDIHNSFAWAYMDLYKEDSPSYMEVLRVDIKRNSNFLLARRKFFI